MLIIEARAFGEIRCCGPVGTGADNLHVPGRYCIGSHCAAWRWWDPATSHPGGVAQVGERIPAPYRRGYCGLAGRPEDDE
jgi:hypothetical protein